MQSMHFLLGRPGWKPSSLLESFRVVNIPVQSLRHGSPAAPRNQPSANKPAIFLASTKSGRVNTDTRSIQIYPDLLKQQRYKKEQIVTHSLCYRQLVPNSARNPDWNPSTAREITWSCATPKNIAFMKCFNIIAFVQSSLSVISSLHYDLDVDL